MVVVRLEKWHFEPAGSSEANNLNSQLTCARQQFEVIDTVKALEKKLEHITKPITVSIIGSKQFLGHGSSKQQAELDGAAKLLKARDIQ